MSFKKLDSGDFVFDASDIAAFAWDNYISSLTSFYTSSLQSLTSYQYYLDIYASNPNTSSTSSITSNIQFSIAYGDRDGSGSVQYSPASPGLSPTRTIYGQFVNLLLGEDENASFDFGPNSNECFFAIVINRSCYKQSILPGSLQIRGLAPNGAYITDNSRITSVVDYTPAGRRFTLGSGSFGDGVLPNNPSAIANGIYGYLYPDIGIIILNPSAFSQTIIEPEGNNPSVFVRGNNINSNNPERLRYYLTQLTLLSEETVSSNYIFCRARNSEFNYSLNPTFETSSFISSYNEFLQVPATYITSVGLYNDNNELLAVAKLSKPLKKEFDTEALVRVKLDF